MKPDGSLAKLSDDALDQVAGGMTADQEEELHGMAAHLKQMGCTKERAKGYFMISDEQLLQEYYDYIDKNWDQL